MNGGGRLNGAGVDTGLGAGEAGLEAVLDDGACGDAATNAAKAAIRNDWEGRILDCFQVRGKTNDLVLQVLSRLKRRYMKRGSSQGTVFIPAGTGCSHR
jgi:hypothetical protein